MRNHLTGFIEQVVDDGKVNFNVISLVLIRYGFREGDGARV